MPAHVRRNSAPGREGFRVILGFLLLDMLLQVALIVHSVACKDGGLLPLAIPLLLLSEVAFMGLLRRKAWAWWAGLLVSCPLPFLLLMVCVQDALFFLSGRIDPFLSIFENRLLFGMRMAASGFFLIPMILLIRKRRHYSDACEEARGSFRAALEKARSGALKR